MPPPPDSAQTSPARPARKRLGLSIASYAIRDRQRAQRGDDAGWVEELMAHAASLGAGAVQFGVGSWNPDRARALRARAESLQLVFEGQVGLPAAGGNWERFEERLESGKEAGITLFRTVLLGGRRYEEFNSAAEWEAFRARSKVALERAARIVSRLRVQLAVENHKDWLADELAAMIRRLGNEWVGVTLDCGNNLSLLEDPMHVIETLAPLALTTHFKDMGVEASEDGFLLSEVPLGAGVLDLKRIRRLCEERQPTLQFNLEMITRDPLRVPCLEPKYWATFGDRPARDLAALLKYVQEHPPSTPLQRPSRLTPSEQRTLEDENLRASFRYAQAELGL